MESVNIKELNDRIQKESAFVDMLSLEMGKVIIGQKQLVENLLIGLLANGHILLEGVPGLAKTLAISTLSKAIDAKFSRIQFTPDLLPADLIGTMIYSQKDESFEVHKGPVFANFVLADEINRSPAKVQSALLEAMQERQVTIGDQTFKLPEPFLVMATQNPIEQEGTYPLPEAQVDRFMLKVIVKYPKKEEERQIIRMNNTGEFPTVNPVIKPEDIVRARSVVRDVYMDEKIERYIVDIVYATRTPDDYGLGKIKDLISSRLTTCEHLIVNGFQSLRFHQEKRLCDPGGCQGRLRRGPSSQDRPYLRGGGRECHDRADHRRSAQRRTGSVTDYV